MMKVTKNKGTTKVKQVHKPVPEPIEYFSLDFWEVVEYFNTVSPGLIDSLVEYWKQAEVFMDHPEQLFLPLPDDQSELYDFTLLVLEQYPEWNRTEFNMSYE